jgi:phospho-N-acetylmuramoyl-pentapeptide-transferase
MAVMLSIILMIFNGQRFIDFLRRKQIGETVRELGLHGQIEKKGTPTMGGILILASIVIPTLLFANLTNVYIWMLLIVSVWLGGIGFIDDYIKVFKKNKEGLSGRFKIIGQIGVGIFVSLMMYFHPDIKVRDLTKVYVYTLSDGKIHDQYNPVKIEIADSIIKGKGEERNGLWYSHDSKSLLTNMPFLKGNDFNYDKVFEFLGFHPLYYFIPFSIILIFIESILSPGYPRLVYVSNFILLFR